MRKHIDVVWSVPEEKIEGAGKIFNISLSGINFETDKLFQPDHGMTVCLKSAQISALPSKGKLVWFKRVGENRSHYQCGIRFLKDMDPDPQWVQWMDENILKLADTGDNKILTRYLTSEEQS